MDTMYRALRSAGLVCQYTWAWEWWLRVVRAGWSIMPGP